MAKRPSKVYDPAQGKLVPIEEADFLNEAPAYEPVYDSNAASAHPDRKNITQKVMDIPDEPEAVRAQVKVNDPNLGKYENFLHSVYDSVFITEADGDIIDVNVRAAHSFMWTRDELLSANIIDLISGADKQVLNLINQNIEKKKFTVLEALCIKKDEALFNAEIVANSLHGDNSLQICFFIRDITERKQVEKELESASEKLAEAEKVQVRMDTLATVLHAINNPLQVLACKAELDDDEDEKQQLQRIMDVIEELKTGEAKEAAADEPSASESNAVPEDTELADCDMGLILVVDDEQPLRDMFTASLSSKFPDMKIESAGDGESALKAFEEKSPGVIIMDVSMPVMNGVNAYHKIIESCKSASKQPPYFIFCTGFSMSEELTQIIADGKTNICLEKPLSLADLTEAVQSRLPQ